MHLSMFNHVREEYPLEESINKYNLDDELRSLKARTCLESVASLLSNTPHDDRRLNCSDSVNIDTTDHFDYSGLDQEYWNLYTDEQEISALHNSLCMMEPRKAGEPIKVAFFGKTSLGTTRTIFNLLNIEKAVRCGIEETTVYPYELSNGSAKAKIELIDVPVYSIIRLISTKKTGMPEYNFVQESLLECQQNFDIGICVTESAGLNHYDKKFCAALLRANKPVIFVVPNAHDFVVANDEFIKKLNTKFYQNLSEMVSFGLSKESLSNIKIFYTYPGEFDIV